MNLKVLQEYQTLGMLILAGSSRLCIPSPSVAYLQAAARWAFGDEGRDGCPPGAAVEIDLALRKVKAVKTIDPDHEGKVTKTILRDGAAYHTPNAFATVRVSWTAALADGTQFDEVRWS